MIKVLRKIVAIAWEDVLPLMALVYLLSQAIRWGLRGWTIYG